MNEVSSCLPCSGCPAPLMPTYFVVVWSTQPRVAIVALACRNNDFEQVRESLCSSFLSSEESALLLDGFKCLLLWLEYGWCLPKAHTQRLGP